MPLTMTPELAVAAAFVATLIVFAAVGGLAVALGSDRSRRRRLERAAGRKLPAGRATQARAASLRRDEVEGRFKWLELALRKSLPSEQKLRARLGRTGYNISLSGYLFTCLAVAATSGGALWIALDGSPAIPLAGGAAIGWLLPRFVVGFLAARRVKRFLQDLPDAIDVMIRGLKSGLPITEMISTVGNDFEGPVGQEFKRVSDNIRFGRSIEEALWDVAARVDIPEFNFLAISVGVQRETGGNLTETLRNLSDLLRKRQQMRLKVRALSSEARASAYIVGALPFIMAGLIYMLNPDYIGKLFIDPRGHWLLGGALLSESIGAAVMFKMVRFEI